MYKRQATHRPEVLGKVGGFGGLFALGSTHRDPKQLLRLATTNKDAAKKLPGKNAIYPPRKPPPPAVPVAVAPELVGLIVLPRSVRSVP